MASILPGKVVQVADKVMRATGMTQDEASQCKVTPKYKPDPSGKQMRCVHYTGKKSVQTMECPKPAVTDDHDAVIKMTSSAICGTDLHLYLNCVPGVKSHQTIGHEVMGIVESVGPAVKNFKPGDRVVVSCQIACGECFFCKEGMFSCCEMTNPSSVQEEMLGGRTAALLGFSELNAGLAGGQADFVRVPIADVNLLKVPSELPDEKVLFLSDILPTAWYGTELAGVKEGDVVAIWGAGPVGQLVAQCAFARGARRVIMVDNVQDRLDYAKKTIPKVETVNFSDCKTSTAGERLVLDLCKDEPAKAPDACIECVGMHYAHSMIHQLEMMTGMETDTPEALNAAIYACRKGGRIGVIGAYVGMCNHFNIGGLMMKCISLRTGQIPLQKYWKQLLEMIQQGKIDPSKIVTHTVPLEDAAKAYEKFHNKTDGVVKIILKPSSLQSASAAGITASTQS